MVKEVLIDGTTLSRQMDGLSQYILNIVKRLDRSNMHFTLLLCPGFRNMPYVAPLQELGIRFIELDVPSIGPRRDRVFRRWLRKNQGAYDLFFCPSNQFPAGVHIPSLYVIHDIIYQEFPEQLGKMKYLKRRVLKRVVKRGLRQASGVIGVSDFTRRHVLTTFGWEFDKKFRVIGEGWEHLVDVDENAKNISLPSHYILYLGSSRGHKNILRLLQAVDREKSFMMEQGYQLVITGDTNRYGAKEHALLWNLRDVVRTTGWVTETGVATVFKGAKAFILPSLSEGFGIPLLEAFYYHVPVVCSNHASLPEVAGDAALYFDPLDVDEIGHAIETAVTLSDEEKARMVQRGLLRNQKYTWEHAAAEISQWMGELCN